MHFFAQPVDMAFCFNFYFINVKFRNSHFQISFCKQVQEHEYIVLKQRKYKCIQRVYFSIFHLQVIICIHSGHKN